MTDTPSLDKLLAEHWNRICHARLMNDPDPKPLRVEMHPEVWRQIACVESDNWKYVAGDDPRKALPMLGCPVVLRADMQPGGWRVIYEGTVPS